MSASIPLWAALLIAAIGPLVTLAGVIFTQRTNDHRAVREAELRLQAQREAEHSERLFTLYQELLVSANDVAFAAPWFGGKLDERFEVLVSKFGRIHAVAFVFAPPDVRDASSRFGHQADWVSRIARDDAELPRTEVENLHNALNELRASVGTALAAEPSFPTLFPYPRQDGDPHEPAR